MSNHSSSSQIYDNDQNRAVLNSLFDGNPREETPKPLSQRKLPPSFFRQPNLSKKTQDLIYQHRRNQECSRSVPQVASHTRTANTPVHPKSISDTTPIADQSLTNSNVSLLPLPEGWEEKLTFDGQIYYIDHITKYTTWVDPRPKHYATFQLYCTTLPLPEGYGKTSDTNGNVYFIDHKHQKTYWNDPRPKYYQSSMRKRLDLPSSISTALRQREKDVLEKQLLDIAEERNMLESRIQELERMEVNARRKIDLTTTINNLPVTDKSAIEALVDELLLCQRQDSTDSGINADRRTTSQMINASISTCFSDDLLLTSSSDYDALSLDNNISLQSSYSMPSERSFQSETNVEEPYPRVDDLKF